MLKPFLKRIRMTLLQKLFYKPLRVGNNFYCGLGTYIRPYSLMVGENVILGRNCRIANSKVIIGDNVMVGSSCAFIDKNDHRYDEADIPMIHSQRTMNDPIIIKNDVWIGYGAIILSGVTINSGAVIGAGSVVTKSVDQNMIVAGNPARPLKNRFK